MKSQAIAVCRVSTAEQKLSNSLNRQEAAVLKAAEQLDVLIPEDGWWSGDISSKAGTNVFRRDLKEMLEYCRTHRAVKYLIVDEPDRFMRSIDEASYFEVSFRIIGVKVWYASDPTLNTNDLGAKIMKFAKYFSAEGSNIERQNKSISGHTKAIGEGRYTFPPKPGYMKGSEPGIHKPHPLEYEPFKRALKDLLSGLYTDTEALKRLNDSEFTKSRSPLKKDKFLKFIVDPYYAGIVTINKQVQAMNPNGKHQSMITVAEHERLKEIVLGRKKNKYERREHNPLFPMNQTSCNECGGKLVGYIHSNGKGWAKPKYRCRSCNRHYNQQVVHDAINAVLDSLSLDNQSRTDFMAALAEVWEHKQQDNIQSIRRLQDHLQSLAATKDQLVRKLASVDESLQDDISESVANLKTEMNEVEAKISKASDFQEDLVEFVEFALNFTNELRNKWWDLSHEQRSRCKQLLFPDGFSLTADEKVYTPQISLLYRLAANKKAPHISRDALLVELRGIAPRSAKLLTTHLQA